MDIWLSYMHIITCQVSNPNVNNAIQPIIKLDPGFYPSSVRKIHPNNLNVFSETCAVSATFNGGVKSM